MSNNDETYNGWANRETWAVALHINNDQGWQESVRDAILAAATDAAKIGPEPLEAWEAGDVIRDNVDNMLDPNEYSGSQYRDHVALIASDIGSLWRVDWTELGRSFLEDLGEADVSSS